MIVVDTNVIASMWVPDDMDEWVYKVLKKDSDWGGGHHCFGAQSLEMYYPSIYEKVF